MAPRYIVRRGLGEQHYSVWDGQRNAVAVLDGRVCADLGMQDAFDAADKLNAGPVQQQQQPQSKDDDKE
jgi:hypothetical protein